MRRAAHCDSPSEHAADSVATLRPYRIHPLPVVLRSVTQPRAFRYVWDNGHMRPGTPDGSGFSRRLPREGWIYVLAVAALATISAVTASLTAYLILLVVTLPSGVAAQITNLTLVFGLAAIFRLEPEGNYPLLGAVTVTVWSVAAWANAKLVHLCWLCARRCCWHDAAGGRPPDGVGRRRGRGPDTA